MPHSRMQWIDANGAVTELNDWSSVWALKGQNNFHSAPFEITSFEVPLQAGAAYASHRVKFRDVDIPLFCMAATRRDFLTKWRSLVSAFNAEKGEGRLRVHNEDGTIRDLRARYLQGLEGATGGRAWSPGSGLGIVTLRALDPFWYPDTPSTDTFSTTGQTTTFFPFFPLELAAGAIFETAVINNPGDHTSWPIWTVTGPCTVLTLTNVTTGFVLEASVSLTNGEVIVIDTRPGYKTVTKNGANLFYTLSSTSVLWGLTIGNNTVDLRLDGSDVNSSVDIQYYPPYLSV